MVTLEEVKRNLIELTEIKKENNINMDSWINKTEFENMIKLAKPEKTLYFNNCNYNQTSILNEFIKLLFKKFDDKMLLNTKYFKITEIENSDNENKKTISFHDSCFYCYASFIIENYIYYIQFDRNPFFENSSVISCDKLYKSNLYYNSLKDKIFYFNSFGGGYNINDLFEIWSKDLDIKESAEKLLNYFMKNKYKNPNATDRTHRITIINQENNINNIKVLE